MSLQRAVDDPGALQGASEGAPFDDTRKALKFALNANQVKMPPAYANRAMGEVPYKAKRARGRALQKLREVEQKAEEERAAGRRLGPGQWPASALDRVHLAGYILHKFNALDEVQRLVLTVRNTSPAVECVCGSPCCSGWRPVPRWVQAVNELCELTKQHAIIIANEGAIPGAPLKVGLSTQPELRRQVIKEWGAHRWSDVSELARRFQLSRLTVSRHRGWIEEWLDTQENNAWIELDAIFARTGITGPFL